MKHHIKKDQNYDRILNIDRTENRDKRGRERGRELQIEFLLRSITYLYVRGQFFNNVLI